MSLSSNLPLVYTTLQQYILLYRLKTFFGHFLSLNVRKSRSNGIHIPSSHNPNVNAKIHSVKCNLISYARRNAKKFVSFIKLHVRRIHTHTISAVNQKLQLLLFLGFPFYLEICSPSHTHTKKSIFVVIVWTHINWMHVCYVIYIFFIRWNIPTVQCNIFSHKHTPHLSHTKITDIDNEHENEMERN